MSRRHELIAVDRISGRARWRRRLRLQVDRPTAGTAVVIENHTVLAADDGLFAFEAETGALRWQFSPREGGSPGAYIGAGAAGMVFAGSASGRVYALNVAAGHVVWTCLPPGDRTVSYSPAVSRGQVFVSYTEFKASRSGGVMALDSTTGAVRWIRRFPEAAPGSGFTASGAAGGPVIAGDEVVATASDGTVYGLDRDAGDVLWTLPSLPNVGEDFRAAYYRRQTLVIASLSGVVVAVDARTRAERWRYVSPADGSIVFDIAGDDDSVYVPFASGRMVAIDLATGRERWRVGGEHQRFEHVPAISDNGVYLTSEDGLYVVARHL